MEDNRVIRASWEDNGDCTEIHSEKELKEMIDRACEILALEDKMGLPCLLVIVVPKKKVLLVD